MVAKLNCKFVLMPRILGLQYKLIPVEIGYQKNGRCTFLNLATLQLGWMSQRLIKGKAFQGRGAGTETSLITSLRW